jgi:hypothetical protein
MSLGHALAVLAIAVSLWPQSGPLSSAKPVIGKSIRYCNPLALETSSRDGSPQGVSLGDVTVVRESDLYYLFGTGGGLVGVLYDRSAKPAGPPDRHGPGGIRCQRYMFVRGPREMPQWAPGPVANGARDGDSGSIPLSVNKLRAMNQRGGFGSRRPGHEAAYALDDSSGTWWEPAKDDASLPCPWISAPSRNSKRPSS